MRFSKISITKKGVDLSRESKDKNGFVEEVHNTSAERPLPAFIDALQAFCPYVQDLLDGAIEFDAKDATITTLNLSEDKNGLRGLIVTAIIPIENAYDKPLVLNTPLVREGGENASDDAFVLDDEVLKLIGLAEAEATRYVKGERIQGDMFADAADDEDSENAKNFDTRAAAASSASTRTPKKGAKHAPTKPTSNGTNGTGPSAKKKSAKQPTSRVADYEIVEDDAPPKVTDAGVQAVRDAVEAGVQ